MSWRGASPGPDLRRTRLRLGAASALGPAFVGRCETFKPHAYHPASASHLIHVVSVPRRGKGQPGRVAPDARRRPAPRRPPDGGEGACRGPGCVRWSHPQQARPRDARPLLAFFENECVFGATEALAEMPRRRLAVLSPVVRSSHHRLTFSATTTTTTTTSGAARPARVTHAARTIIPQLSEEEAERAGARRGGAEAKRGRLVRRRRQRAELVARLEAALSEATALTAATAMTAASALSSAALTPSASTPGPPAAPAPSPATDGGATPASDADDQVVVVMDVRKESGGQPPPERDAADRRKLHPLVCSPSDQWQANAGADASPDAFASSPRTFHKASLFCFPFRSQPLTEIGSAHLQSARPFPVWSLGRRAISVCLLPSASPVCGLSTSSSCPLSAESSRFSSRAGSALGAAVPALRCNASQTEQTAPPLASGPGAGAGAGALTRASSRSVATETPPLPPALALAPLPRPVSQEPLCAHSPPPRAAEQDAGCPTARRRQASDSTIFVRTSIQSNSVVKCGFANQRKTCTSELLIPGSARVNPTDAAVVYSSTDKTSDDAPFYLNDTLSSSTPSVSLSNSSPTISSSGGNESKPLITEFSASETMLTVSVSKTFLISSLRATVDSKETLNSPDSTYNEGSTSRLANSNSAVCRLAGNTLSDAAFYRPGSIGRTDSPIRVHSEPLLPEEFAASGFSAQHTGGGARFLAAARASEGAINVPETVAERIRSRETIEAFIRQMHSLVEWSSSESSFAIPYQGMTTQGNASTHTIKQGQRFQQTTTTYTDIGEVLEASNKETFTPRSENIPSKIDHFSSSHWENKINKTRQSQNAISSLFSSSKLYVNTCNTLLDGCVLEEDIALQEFSGSSMRISGITENTLNDCVFNIASNIVDDTPTLSATRLSIPVDITPTLDSGSSSICALTVFPDQTINLIPDEESTQCKLDQPPGSSSALLSFYPTATIISAQQTYLRQELGKLVTEVSQSVEQLHKVAHVFLKKSAVHNKSPSRVKIRKSGMGYHIMKENSKTRGKVYQCTVGREVEKERNMELKRINESTTVQDVSIKTFSPCLHNVKNLNNSPKIREKEDSEDETHPDNSGDSDCCLTIVMKKKERSESPDSGNEAVMALQTKKGKEKGGSHPTSDGRIGETRTAKSIQKSKLLRISKRPFDIAFASGDAVGNHKRQGVGAGGGVGGSAGGGAGGGVAGGERRRARASARGARRPASGKVLRPGSGPWRAHPRPRTRGHAPAPAGSQARGVAGAVLRFLGLGAWAARAEGAAQRRRRPPLARRTPSSSGSEASSGAGGSQRERARQRGVAVLPSGSLSDFSFSDSSARSPPADDTAANPTRNLPRPPTGIPTSNYTDVPIGIATGVRPGIHTGHPTNIPIGIPTCVPTGIPTDVPTGIPAGLPTDIPTCIPTSVLLCIPTGISTGVPAEVPPGIPVAYPVATEPAVGGSDATEGEEGEEGEAEAPPAKVTRVEAEGRAPGTGNEPRAPSARGFHDADAGAATSAAAAARRRVTSDAPGDGARQPPGELRGEAVAAMCPAPAAATARDSDDALSAGHSSGGARSLPYLLRRLLRDLEPCVRWAPRPRSCAALDATSAPPRRPRPRLRPRPHPRPRPRQRARARRPPGAATPPPPPRDEEGEEEQEGEERGSSLAVNVASSRDRLHAPRRLVQEAEGAARKRSSLEVLEKASRLLVDALSQSLGPVGHTAPATAPASASATAARRQHGAQQPALPRDLLDALRDPKSQLFARRKKSLRRRVWRADAQTDIPQQPPAPPPPPLSKRAKGEGEGGPHARAVRPLRPPRGGARAGPNAAQAAPWSAPRRPKARSLAPPLCAQLTQRRPPG